MNIFVLILLLILAVFALGLVLFICNVLITSIFGKGPIGINNQLHLPDLLLVYRIFKKDKCIQQAQEMIVRGEIEKSLGRIFEAHLCLTGRHSKKVILQALGVNQKVIEMLNKITRTVEFDYESIHELDNLFKMQSNLLIGYMETCNNLDRLQKEQKQKKGERDWAIAELRNKQALLNSQLNDNNSLIQDLISLVLDKVEKALSAPSNTIQYH